MPSASATPWTDENVQLLRDMAAKGKQPELIAHVLRRSRRGILDKALTLGLSFSKQQKWTDEEIATVREMWAAGKSAGRIAAALGNGRSRNAVLGYIHRNKIPGRVTKARTKSAPKRRSPQVSRWRSNQRPASLADGNAGAIQFREANSYRHNGKPAIETPPSVAGAYSSSLHYPAADAGAGEISPFAPLAPVALPVPLLELTARSCRYIVEGEGEYALFCNAPRLEHGPYCPSHAARCYTAPERRRAA